MPIDFQFEHIARWAQSFDTCCLLNSHLYADKYGDFDFLAAVGVTEELIGDGNVNFEDINYFSQQQWCFGFLSYELKNRFIYHLHTEPKEDKLGFPDFYFFKPKFLLVKPKNAPIQVLIGDENDCIAHLNKYHFSPSDRTATGFEIVAKLSKAQYIQKVKDLQKHIRRGDIYEVNFCQEFYVENIFFNSFELFEQLEKVSPKPFSFYFKWKDKTVIGASPERFLIKKGRQLWTQPIKGTAPASAQREENDRFKSILLNSEKERSENVMIVDLMRNDLTKIAEARSVRVEELFGIYTFAQVNQMISTITCILPNSIQFSSIIEATFPMGSMSGAPKIKALELIEKFEPGKRGVFSGSVGYINPQGDFDLNVVIRSILYNQQEKYLSFQVGSAITHLSDPELEYEECMLKAKAIFEVLKVYQQ